MADSIRFYKSGQANNIELPSANYDWTTDSMKYTAQQIGEMPYWIVTLKENFQLQLTPPNLIDVSSCREMQNLANDIITKHSKSTSKEEALLLIINGVAGTGKSYLKRALKSYHKQKCVITATKGKAAYNIRGVTVHSLLKLPTGPLLEKDLSRESLVELQDGLSNTDYILIDEYSMLGQILGWVDKRCRQSSGANENLFREKSIILIGDPAQLPPVSDKPLYHAKPSHPIGAQGYYAYMMVNHVVTLTVKQKVKGTDPDQIIFKNFLLRLRNGEMSENDWKLLLFRQPSQANNIDQFTLPLDYFIPMRKWQLLITILSYNSNNQLQKLKQNIQVLKLPNLVLRKCMDWNQHYLFERIPLLCLQ